MSHIGASLQIHMRNPSEYKSWWLCLASYFNCVGLSVLELTWHEWFFHQLPSQLCVCVCCQTLHHTHTHQQPNISQHFDWNRQCVSCLQAFVYFSLFMSLIFFHRVSTIALPPPTPALRPSFASCHERERKKVKERKQLISLDTAVLHAI